VSPLHTMLYLFLDEGLRQKFKEEIFLKCSFDKPYEVLGVAVNIFVNKKEGREAE